MALIKCPECGKEISDFADKCVYCGYPIRSTKSKAADKFHSERKKASNLVNVVSDKIASVNNLYKIMMIFSITMLLFIMLVVSFTFRSQPIIRNAKIGMSKDELIELEPHRTVHNGLICVDGTYEFDERGTAWYEFDENDKLSSIMFNYYSSSYRYFSDVFYRIVDKFGYPDVCVGQFANSEDTVQRFYWNIGRDTMLLFYNGSYHEDSAFSILVEHQGTINRKNEVTVNFQKNRTCAVDGCSKDAQPWSSYCNYHGCEIIGCKNASAGNVDRMSICENHSSMALIGVVDAR